MSVLLYNESFKIEEYPLSHNDFIEYSHKSNHKGCLLVPTSKLIRKLNFKYIYSSEIPVSEISIFNIEKFVKQIFWKFFDYRHYIFISDAYKRALFEEAAALTDFQLYAAENGSISLQILEKLETIITGLKGKGISADEVSTQTEVDKFDNKRLSDVSELYKNYQHLLGDKYLDYPETISKLIDYINNPDNEEEVKTSLSDFDFILLSGFSQFTIPEARLFGSIAKLNIPFAVNVDLDENNAPVFGNLNEIIQMLQTQTGFELSAKQLTFDKVEEKTPVNYNNSPASLALRKWLFNTEVNVNNNILKDCLKIFEAEDINDEVESITKLVKYLILEKGYNPYDICITSRQPEKYSGLFRMHFASAGIPVNISDRFSLDSSIVVIAITDAINIISKGFRTNDVFRFLQNPLIELDSNIDVNNLMYVTAKLRYKGGKYKGGIERWAKTVKSSIEFFKNEFHKDEYDEYEKKNIKIQQESYEKALEDINSIKDKFKKSLNINEIKIDEFERFVVEDIIDNFNIKENILELFNDLNQNDYNKKSLINRKVEELEKNSRALTAFLSVLSELTGIQLVRKPNELYELEELYQKLILSLQATKYNISEKQDYGVEITSIEQSRGIPYKVMLLCGAIDGVFPMAYRTDTYLGMEFNDAEDKHMREEQIQFYQFLTNNMDLLDRAEQELYIFYPANDNERELIRSHFVDSLLRIAASDNDMHSLVFSLEKERDTADTQFEWLNSITTENEFYYKHAGISDNNYFIKQISEIKKITENQKINGEIIKDDISDENKKYLELMKEKTYSISALETYKDCPYKYFAQRIAGFNEKEEFDKGLSFMESGSILHFILFRFFQDVKEKPELCSYVSFNGINGIRLKQTHKEDYKRIIKNIANEVFAMQNIDTAFFNADKYNITKEGGVLDTWIEFEINRQSENSFYATLFEKSFPENKREPVRLPNGVKVSGKIDRIDLLQNSDVVEYVVIDYKRTSSSAKSIGAIEKGESFQMPVYIEATRQILNPYIENSIYNSAIYYPIYIKDEKDIKIVLKNSEKNDFKIENSFSEIENVINDITNGQFPVLPKNERSCEYCGFMPVCRIKE